MGKVLIIKGADFSSIAIDTISPTPSPEPTKTYLYGFSDAQYTGTTKYSGLETRGYAPVNQDVLRNKILSGVRLLVSEPGTLSIYKTDNLSESSVLIKVATITTTSAGLQDLPFSSPVTLKSGEYIVLSSSEATTDSLIALYHSNVVSGNLKPQDYAYKIGQVGFAMTTNGRSFDIDFYTEE